VQPLCFEKLPLALEQRTALDELRFDALDRFPQPGA
jgi:hypothetical protein